MLVKTTIAAIAMLTASIGGAALVVDGSADAGTDAEFHVPEWPQPAEAESRLDADIELVGPWTHLDADLTANGSAEAAATAEATGSAEVTGSKGDASPSVGFNGEAGLRVESDGLEAEGYGSLITSIDS